MLRWTRSFGLFRAPVVGRTHSRLAVIASRLKAGVYPALLGFALTIAIFNGIQSAWIPSIVKEWLKLGSAYALLPEIQGSIVGCLAAYLVYFITINSHRTGRLQIQDALCLAATGLVLFSYYLNLDSAAGTKSALNFVYAVTLAQAIRTWVLRSPLGNSCTAFAFVCILLLCAGISNPGRSHLYTYQGIPRWTGPWGNPNAGGLLMGTAFVMVVCGACFIVRHRGTPENQLILRPMQFVLLSALGAIIVPIVLSYSRGAWLATFVAVFAWGLYWRRPSHGVSFGILTPKAASLQGRNAVILGAVLVAGVAFSSSPLSQRFFSLGLSSDFSVQNRFAAWIGALRMMADHPLCGVGWGNATRTYAELYMLNWVVEPGALLTNDYLLVGVVAGIPALLFFSAYIYSCLCPSIPSSAAGSGEAQGDSVVLANAWRSSALVIAVGIGLDGGLFDLPTSVVFSTALQLSRLESIL